MDSGDDAQDVDGRLKLDGGLGDADRRCSHLFEGFYEKID